MNGLRRVVDERFDENELRTLCQDLEVDYDGLPGQGKSGKVRELVGHFARRDQIVLLTSMVTALRPDIAGELKQHAGTPNSSASLLSSAQLQNGGEEYRATVLSLFDRIYERQNQSEYDASRRHSILEERLKEMTTRSRMVLVPVIALAVSAFVTSMISLIMRMVN